MKWTHDWHVDLWPSTGQNHWKYCKSGVCDGNMKFWRNMLFTKQRLLKCRLSQSSMANNLYQDRYIYIYACISSHQTGSPKHLVTFQCYSRWLLVLLLFFMVDPEIFVLQPREVITSYEPSTHQFPSIFHIRFMSPLYGISPGICRFVRWQFLACFIAFRWLSQLIPSPFCMKHMLNETLVFDWFLLVFYGV